MDSVPYGAAAVVVGFAASSCDGGGVADTTTLPAAVSEGCWTLQKGFL